MNEIYGKRAVMEFLAYHEGLMFTTQQIADHLGMSRETVTGIIGRIRRDYFYRQHYRSRIQMRDDGVKVAYHYVRLWTRKELFEMPKT